MTLLRKYGVETQIVFPVVKLNDTDFATSGDWTPASGDAKVSKDGGDVADTSNTPAAVGGTGSVLWTLTLTATEMQAARIAVQIVDAALEHTVLLVETYGHDSGQHAVDLDDAVRAGLGALPNAVADAAGGLPISDAGGLDCDAQAANVAAILADTGTDGVLIAAGAIGASTFAADALSAAALSAAAVNKILDRLYLRRDTAQGGGATTITLDAAASATNDLYDALIVAILSGTGAGQARTVTGYVGSTKVATVDAAWATAPDNTSEFALLPVTSSAAAVALIQADARLARAGVANKRTFDQSLAQKTIYDNDGATVLATLNQTASSDGTVVTEAPA